MAAPQQPLEDTILVFRGQQRYLQERFSRYRRGDGTFIKDMDEIIADRNAGFPGHWNRMLRRRVPRLPYQGRLTDAARARLQAVADNQQARYGVQAPPLDDLGPPEMAAGRAAFSRASAPISADRNFTFIKTLGGGGGGIVTLWRWTPAQGPGHSFVMKVSNMGTAERPDTRIIQWERQVMTTLRRAPHTSQRFIFSDVLPQFTSARVGERQRRQANNLDDTPWTVFMEYAKMGDLEKCIHKLGRLNNDFPPQAMWHILDCLVKGCIAMEYPPRFVPRPGQPVGRVATARGDFLPEVVPPGGEAGRVPGFRGFVHFDLDPKNIFIAGYDEPDNTPLNPTHDRVPRFQIADFGLALDSDELWTPVDYPGSTALDQWTRRWVMWNQRMTGKPRWTLPEQFSGDWDQLDLDPTVGPAPWPLWTPWPVVAGPGRYTHRSNIWHIGMNMWCFMFRLKPSVPPVAGRMTTEEPAGVAYDQVPPADQRWTYGYRLIDGSQACLEARRKFGAGLCETVARCLMARQDHRPDLQQLQAGIAAALAAGPPPPPRVVRRFFGNPGLPTVPWRTEFVRGARIDPFDNYGDEAGDHLAPPPRPRRRRPRQQDRAYRGRD